MKQPTDEQLTRVDLAGARLGLMALNQLVSAALRKDAEGVKFIDAVADYLVLVRGTILDIPATASDNKNSSTSPIADATGDPNPA